MVCLNILYRRQKEYAIIWISNIEVEPLISKVHSIIFFLLPIVNIYNTLTIGFYIGVFSPDNCKKYNYLEGILSNWLSRREKIVSKIK